MAALVISSLLLSAFLSVNCASVGITIDLHQQQHNDVLNSFQKLYSSIFFQLQYRKLFYHFDF